jgi:type IV pilus assembly protein PilE
VKRTQWNSRPAGFTLVELLVVILVAAILVSIAVPSYQNQVRKSRRTDAKTAVLDLAAREEKYLSLNNTYTPVSGALGYASSTTTSYISGLTVGSGYYQIYVCVAAGSGTTAPSTPCIAASGSATGTTYVVAAIPVAGTSQAADSLCQYFAVDNTGTQFATSSNSGSGTDTTSTCWQ